MARIRTIKPEFFTSEDIVSLTPYARLLYIALWCEADREGRLAWKPKTFKMRYLPGDSIDINALCDEIVGAGLVKLYGDSLAYIPAFHAHQHINPREAASQLPEPSKGDAKTTRAARVIDASMRDSDPQVGREGKGKEGDTEPNGSGGKPPSDMTKDELWSAGKSILTQAGMPPKQCGSFVGKLVNDYGDAIVVEAVRAAVVARPADPAEYLKAACMRSAGQRKTTPRPTSHTGLSSKDYAEGVTADGTLI